MAVCRVCGRTAPVVVSVEREGRGAVKFPLCEAHTLLAEQVPKLGEDRAMGESAKVGQIFVNTLSEAWTR